MGEESTTVDVVALVRGAFEAASSGDVEALMAFCAPDAVMDGTRTLGVAPQGRAAIRVFVEDWMAAYEDMEWAVEELVDVGNGIVFTAVVNTGRPVGVDGYVHQREAWVSTCVGGLISSLTHYPEAELSEARVDAERLAEEQG